MEEVAFHLNLQQPINLKWYECKSSFEFVMCKDLPLFLFDIVAVATNGKPLLKRSSSHSHSSPVLQRFCLLSGQEPSATVVLGPVPRSIH